MIVLNGYVEFVFVFVFVVCFEKVVFGIKFCLMFYGNDFVEIGVVLGMMVFVLGCIVDLFDNFVV